MEAIWYTLLGVILYLVANRALSRVEIARGERFEHRSIIFFFLLLGLALVSFWLIRAFIGIQ